MEQIINGTIHQLIQVGYSSNEACEIVANLLETAQEHHKIF